MRIAVVGGGIAGLSAARALAGRHQVELFEREEQPGGHVVTVQDRGLALDCGFLVFNERRYPRFARLLAELGIASRPTSMAFSVSAADGSVEWGSASLSAAFARRRDLFRPAHHRMLAAVLRFLVRARRDLKTGSAAGLTLEAYAERIRLPSPALEYFLVPLASSLWSLGRREAGALPAELFLRFLEVHGMLRPVLPPRWRTIAGGSRRYVDALLARAPIELHLGAAVTGLERDQDGATLHLRGGGARRFDAAVLALHADQALALLADPTADERRVLGAFRFSDSEVVLHTDASLLPQAPAARASWNVRVEGDGGGASITYWLNRLQGLDTRTPFLVTLNPRRPIADHRAIRRLSMRHPSFDVAALRAQREIPHLQGVRRTYYAGAWCGFGFHEDGVSAGLAAAEKLR